MLSRSAQEKELKAAQAQAHVLQFAHLVVSACQPVGVGLQISSVP